MSDVSTFNVSAASNNSAAPNGFPEGMPPSGVNDAAREVMAAIARWYAQSDASLASAGTGNAYTVTTGSSPTAYADMPLLTFRVDRANTDAVTLNVDNLGAKSLRAFGHALQPGYLQAGTVISVAYSSADDAIDIVNAPDRQFVYRSANVSRASTTTLTADTELAGLVLKASKLYQLDGLIVYDQNGGDLKFDFAFSNGPNDFFLSWVAVDADAVEARDFTSSNTAQAITTMTDTRVASLSLRGTVLALGSDDTMSFRWAQNTLSANNTTLRRSSWLRLTRIT